MHLLRADSEPPQLLENFVGRLRPFKRLALLVVGVDVREDRVAELRHTRMRAALQGVRRQQSELKGLVAPATFAEAREGRAAGFFLSDSETDISQMTGRKSGAGRL